MYRIFLPESSWRAGAPRAGPMDPTRGGLKTIQMLPLPALESFSRSDVTPSKSKNTRQQLLVSGINNYTNPVSDEAVGIFQVYLVFHPSPRKRARIHTRAALQDTAMKKTPHGSTSTHVRRAYTLNTHYKNDGASMKNKYNRKKGHEQSSK